MPFFCRFLESWLSISPIVAVALRERVEPLHHHRVGFRIERAERRVSSSPAISCIAHAAGDGA